jgi:hypothetical protein
MASIFESRFQNIAQRRAANRKTISESMAVEIARLIALKDHGDRGAKAQLPFAITAIGDYWHVLGNANDASEKNEFGKHLPIGQLSLRISQYDGQIVDLIYNTRIEQWAARDK